MKQRRIQLTFITAAVFCTLMFSCLVGRAESREWTTESGRTTRPGLTEGRSTSPVIGSEREWSSRSGKRMNAALVQEREDTVLLRTSDGKRREVRKDILSDADIRYLKNRLLSTSWSAWRSDDRDGKSEDRGLLRRWPEDGPEKLWEINDLGKGFSSVSVANEKIFITGAKNGRLVIQVFDIWGNRGWQTEHGAAWTKNYPGPRASVTVHNDRAYLLSGRGKVACYDAQSGNEVWSRRMSEFGGNTPNWGYAESVLIVDDKAIVTPGGKNCMVALDTQTGRTIWTSRGNGAKAHYCSAIAVPYRGRTMLVNGNRGGIFGVDASDGKVRWSNDFCSGNTANCPTPAYSKKRVFWANGYGKGGICLKLDDSSKGVTAEESWRTRKMVCHHGGYIIHEGYIYGNHNGGWSCIDLTTGEQRWFERGVGKGSLCYADGMLYLFSERGGKAALVEATPEGFRMSGSFSVSGKGPSWAHPVVTGGRLYLRYGSNLYCYNVRR